MIKKSIGAKHFPFIFVRVCCVRVVRCMVLCYTQSMYLFHTLIAPIAAAHISHIAYACMRKCLEKNMYIFILLIWIQSKIASLRRIDRDHMHDTQRIFGVSA